SFAGAEIVQKKEKPHMAYLMYVSAALTHLWAIYAPQNQYWIMKGCRTPTAVIAVSAVELI
ncbi:MAG: hypothetical protein IJK64_11305, partial [Clostridia bacterium]|nr:hypothetical protein [Clostridia bacterium]